MRESMDGQAVEDQERAHVHAARTTMLLQGQCAQTNVIARAVFPDARQHDNGKLLNLRKAVYKKENMTGRKTYHTWDECCGDDDVNLPN